MDSFRSAPCAKIFHLLTQGIFCEGRDSFLFILRRLMDTLLSSGSDVYDKLEMHVAWQRQSLLTS